MPINSFWSTSPSLTSATPGAATPNATDLATSPTALSPDKFRTWTPEKQRDYINTHGTVPAGAPAGTPKSVMIGAGDKAIGFSLANTNALQLTMEQTFRTASGSTTVIGTEAFNTQNVGREARETELVVPPNATSARTFLEWSRESQLAYVERHRGSATSLTIGVEPTATNRYGNQISVTVVPDVVAKAGVIQHTPGDFEPIPYHHINGSANGMPSAIVQASAEALFPALGSTLASGQTVTLPVEDRPDKFYMTLSQVNSGADPQQFLDDFATWHSGYQLEWVKKNGSGTPRALEININGVPALTAMVSASDSKKLLILQSLDKATFAKLTLLEQTQASNSTTFPTLKGIHGLDRASAALVKDVTSSSETSVSPKTAVTNFINYINGKDTANSPDLIVDQRTQSTQPTVPGYSVVRDAQNEIVYTQEWKRLDPFNNNSWSLVRTYSKMPEEDRKAFTSQLDLLSEQLDKMGVVSTLDINRQLAELKERFDRAFAFLDINMPQKKKEAMGIPSKDLAVYERSVTSSGNISGIQNGYKIFIAQEKRIAELANARMDIAKDASIFGKTLDAPSLVYKLQSLYNLAGEARVVMETEEINQQNALLKSYAAMQEIINKTLGNFDKAGEGDSYILGYDDSDDTQNLSDAEMRTISMFEDLLGSRKHPLEVLAGNFERPKLDIFKQNSGQNDNYDLNKFTNNEWGIYSQRLSEAVTILNQNSQLKMNEVNSLDKQRNRHFELANSALSKMSEMVSSIARI